VTRNERRASRNAMHYETEVRVELSDRSGPKFAGLDFKARDGRTALVGKVLSRSGDGCREA
jgi:hypothetical protein